MLPRFALLAVVGLLAAGLAGCVTPDSTPGAVNAPGTSGGLAFKTIAIPQSSGVSEPSIGVDHKGHVYVSAPTGLPSASKLWKSEDNGTTWKSLVPNPTALGGGDTSIALGPRDEVYVTDLWAGSATISASHDGGKTWASTPLASEVPYYDREWNTVDAKGHAYFLGRTFTPGAAAWVSRSDDGGATWVHAGNPWINPDPNHESQDGPFITNPKTDAIAVVYNCPATDGTVPVSPDAAPAVCVSVSKDLGATWTQHVAARAQGNVGNDFAGLAADNAGNWYVAYSETTKDGTALRWAWSADGAKWSQPQTLADGPGNRMFPWISAGDAGRIAIAWYGTDAKGNTNDNAGMKDAKWSMVVAISTNAMDANPTFVQANVTPEPVHTGTISTQGFDPTSQDPPDRSLGDFFTSTVGPDGRLHLAFMKSLNGQKDIACLYAVQTGGPSLYAPDHVAPAAPTAAPNAPLPITVPGLPAT